MNFEHPYFITKLRNNVKIYMHHRDPKKMKRVNTYLKKSPNIIHINIILVYNSVHVRSMPMEDPIEIQGSLILIGIEMQQEI
jgi:hypothetical protein